MKITELKCSACDGTLKIDEQNPHYAECEYCHTRYTIEWDRPGSHGAPGEGDAHLTRVNPGEGLPPRIQYQPVPDRPRPPLSKGAKLKQIIVAGACAAAFIAVVTGVELYRQGRSEDGLPAHTGSVQGGAGSQTTAEEAGKDAAADTELSGLLAKFAEAVFGRPAGEIREEELARIQWLEIRSTIENRRVGYSFENLLEDPEAALIWLEFPRDDGYAVELSCLPAFTGLKALDAGQSLRAENVAGLKLESVSGYFDSLDEAAALVEQPELLKRIAITGSTVSLSGIEKLPHLESLILDTDSLEEERLLVSGTSLKEVALDMYSGSMDFTIFGVMPWLEALTIESENLRDIGFVSKMTGLKELNLRYGEFISLDALKDNTRLEALSILSCGELKDLSVLEGLTGLRSLTLELPYGCPEPDLSALTAMEEMYLDGFTQTGFLRSMENLRELTLDSCTVDTPSDFGGLVNLKSLTCSSFGYMERDYSFVTSLPALEELDMHGTITYGDIADIFNMPSLRTLNISGMECVIGFDRIEENTHLESLSVNHMKTYANVSVSGGGGIYSVDWDDVEFTEHLDFLAKLKGLKHLSIRENDLTDLSFVSELPALESIDFGDNYVTDLSPLSGLRALKQVTCTDNPVSNFEVLGDSVTVIR